VEKPMDSIDNEYIQSLRRLKRCWGDAISTSDQARAIHAGERRYWSSILLVRVCLTTRSLMRLCPDLDFPDPIMHWDFASAASITRNLFECGMFFLYFTKPVEPEEWRTRLNLMQLRDCTERMEMFRAFGADAQVRGFEDQASDLKKRLSENSYFQSLDAKFQKQLLQGKRASLFTLRELATEFIQDEGVWWVYQALSSNIHSQPFSFYRTADHNRIGVENDVDKTYITMAMNFASDLIEQIVAAYRADFNDLINSSPIGTAPSVRLLQTGRASKKAPSIPPNRDALCPCGSKQKFRWCHGME